MLCAPAAGPGALAPRLPLQPGRLAALRALAGAGHLQGSAVMAAAAAAAGAERGAVTAAAAAPAPQPPPPGRLKVLVLTGPTAVGKTSASLALAAALGGEVISADSVQVYRGLDVGSDKARRRGARALHCQQRCRCC